jgi:hypothetical protein
MPGRGELGDVQFVYSSFLLFDFQFITFWARRHIYTAAEKTVLMTSTMTG